MSKKLKPDCYANWVNDCHSNEECCSGICYVGDANNWRDGVCQPKSSTIQGNCLPKWSNSCKESVNCCTGYCDKGPESVWLSGVCKSREILGVKPQGKREILFFMTDFSSDHLPLNIAVKDCQKNWFNKCQSDVECCSNYCYMEPGMKWQYGICKERRDIESIEQKNCYPMFYEGCQDNSDCCTDLLCDKRHGVNIGTCKPYTALKILNEDNEWIECFEDWYEFCTEDEHCCSGICHRFDDIKSNFKTFIAYGLCVPDIRIVPMEIVQALLAKYSPNEMNKEQDGRARTRTTRAVSVADKKVICYVGSWANYKQGDGRFVCIA